jgi:hypothetical protein
MSSMVSFDPDKMDLIENDRRRDLLEGIVVQKVVKVAPKLNGELMVSKDGFDQELVESA